jgi:hypothetical protein
MSGLNHYPKNGLLCSVCHEPQYRAPSGPVCVKGHGGADGYPTPLRSMPVQKPGKSKQDYGTPWPFFRAVEEKLINARFDVDLAAHIENTKVPHNFVDVTRNSLSINWSVDFAGKLGWLNPEFANIRPWAEKCNAEKGLRIVMLTPSSIDSNWYMEIVHPNALVISVGPRLTFEGCKDPYPKGCILSLWNFTDDDGKPVTGFDVWRWDR